MHGDGVAIVHYFPAPHASSSFFRALDFPAVALLLPSSHDDDHHVLHRLRNAQLPPQPQRKIDPDHPHQMSNGGPLLTVADRHVNVDEVDGRKEKVKQTGWPKAMAKSRDFERTPTRRWDHRACAEKHHFCRNAGKSRIRGTEVRIGDAQGSTVVLLILHRHPAPIRFGIGEQCGRVEPLVVHQWPTVAPAAVAHVPRAIQDTRGADPLGRREPSEDHGVTNAIIARVAVRCIVFAFCHARRSSVRQQARPAQHTDVALRFRLAGGGAGGSFGVSASLPSPEEGSGQSDRG
nr:hypothetical protein CFP56_24608 [Quercus suber]